MVLESTVILVDNSEYMRNGDYVPNRLQAQQDAANTLCRFKLRSNPENNVGLIAMSDNVEIVTTLTTDAGKVLSMLHRIQPGGSINLVTGLKVAHLALKHRIGRSHKMRIICFVGSPLEDDTKDMMKFAKRMKKESVQIDIVNFGETENNSTKLQEFVNLVNGKDSTASHLVTVPSPCSDLSKALLTSPIMVSEDGAPNPQFAGGSSFEFGVDPNEDPELALALRVSMEEQRQRQQEETRRTDTGDEPMTDATADAAATPAAATTEDTPAAKPASAASATPAPAAAAAAAPDEDEMLQQALAMSLDAAGGSMPAPAAPSVDFATMTEDEQIAYAMQISMQEPEPMEVDSKKEKKEDKKKGSEDMSSVMNDAAFLEGVLNKLPGVNPQSDVVKQAIDSYSGGSSSSQSKEEQDKKKKEKEEQEKKE